MANSELMVGMEAPDFPGLKDYRGKIIILYFYPKDMTPGCTQEACDFRDRFAELTKLDAVVLGISKDSTESHQRFREKYGLPFQLLSDPKGEIITAYGAWKRKLLFGKTSLGIARITFIIDQEGIIRRMWTTVDVKRHAEEVTFFVRLLRGQQTSGLLRAAAGITTPTAGCAT